MDVLLPRSLEEALEMKAARPEGLPIAGGTDVMVEINFDRHRPEAMIDISRLEELRTWRGGDGSTVLGGGGAHPRGMGARPRVPPRGPAAPPVGPPPSPQPRRTRRE